MFYSVGVFGPAGMARMLKGSMTGVMVHSFGAGDVMMGSSMRLRDQ